MKAAITLGFPTFWLFDTEMGGDIASKYSQEKKLQEFRFLYYTFNLTYLKKNYNFFNHSFNPYQGNHFFIVIDFILHHSFENIWFLEFDVVYTGSWIDIFSQHGNDTLVLIQEAPIKVSNKWFWARFLPTARFGRFFHQFIQIGRISRNFAVFLNERYNHLTKNTYHVEAFYYTTLYQSKYYFPYDIIQAPHKYLQFADDSTLEYAQGLLDMRAKGYLIHPIKLNIPLPTNWND